MEQDLLKCLHHFAAKYYSEKGQLIDASRIARQKKRARTGVDQGSRSGSCSTVDSVSGEESDYSGAGIALAPPVTLQTPKQKGRQGADLLKDMYKMLDGSALVALGRHSFTGVTLVIHRGIQGFSCTSISNNSFDGTGSWVLRRTPNIKDWFWWVKTKTKMKTKRTASICERGTTMFTGQ